jgi:hypothetical protein
VKITSAKVDNSAIQAEDGVWQGDLPELGDIEVLVRGLNNKQYRLKFEAMVRALPPNKRKNGAVDPIERDRITGVCLLECNLRGWRNVEDDDCVAVPYSKDQAKVYMTDPDYQKFRDGVFVASSRVGEVVAEDDAATEKNSAKPSGTV